VQQLYFALTGAGYEVHDLIHDPERQIEVLEERMAKAGMDLEDARNTAMSNVRRHYTSRMQATTLKGGRGWKEDFSEYLKHLQEFEGDPNRFRNWYYDELETALKVGNPDLAKRSLWALEQLGAGKSHVQGVMIDNRGITREQWNTIR